MIYRNMPIIFHLTVSLDIIVGVAATNICSYQPSCDNSGWCCLWYVVKVCLYLFNTYLISRMMCSVFKPINALVKNNNGLDVTDSVWAGKKCNHQEFWGCLSFKVDASVLWNNELIPAFHLFKKKSNIVLLSVCFVFCLKSPTSTTMLTGLSSTSFGWTSGEGGDWSSFFTSAAASSLRATTVLSVSANNSPTVATPASSQVDVTGRSRIELNNNLDSFGFSLLDCV